MTTKYCTKTSYPEETDRSNAHYVYHKLYDEGPAFAINSRGVLVHRIRKCKDLIFVDSNELSHSHVTYFCGGGANDSGNITYTDEIPKGRVLCARCEAVALTENEKSAEAITKKRHVCKGGVRVFRTCGCSNDDN